ncbi:MAG TPA: hypothetical protein VGG08_02920 [Solirubrobacteraceae bacterium]|jgi:hypothetical protein
MLVASGCGSSGSSSSGAAATQSSSQTRASSVVGSNTPFGADADAICKRLNATLAKRTVPKLTLAVIARISPGRALLEKAAVGELEHLNAPTADKASWEQLLVVRRTLASELSQLGRAAKSGNQNRVTQLTASKKAHHAEEKAVAAKLGLKDCSSVG